MSSPGRAGDRCPIAASSGVPETDVLAGEVPGAGSTGDAVPAQVGPTVVDDRAAGCLDRATVASRNLASAQSVAGVGSGTVPAVPAAVGEGCAGRARREPSAA
ncbi:hypothetical protein GCM10010524_37780 [Streptomyces mexicanus]